MALWQPGAVWGIQLQVQTEELRMEPSKELVSKVYGQVWHPQE